MWKIHHVADLNWQILASVQIQLQVKSHAFPCIFKLSIFKSTIKTINFFKFFWLFLLVIFFVYYTKDVLQFNMDI